MKLEKVRAEASLPEIDKFIDFATQIENGQFTPGGTAEIKGEMLKVDVADLTQGIFFIAVDGTETRTEIYMRNKPSDVIFNIPSGLVVGTYLLEIRTKINSSSVLKKQKFNEDLEVV